MPIGRIATANRGNCSAKQRGGQWGEQPNDRTLTVRRIWPQGTTHVRRPFTTFPKANGHQHVLAAI